MAMTPEEYRKFRKSRIVAAAKYLAGDKSGILTQTDMKRGEKQYLGSRNLVSKATETKRKVSQQALSYLAKTQHGLQKITGR